MADDMTLLKERQSCLENRVTQLEGKVAAESIARASMEDDLNGVKATQKMVQALVTSSSEHSRQLGALDQKVSGVSGQLDQMDRKFDRRIEGLEISVNGRFDGMDKRFDRLEASVDGRFDAVDARFTKVDERFDAVDARFTKVDKRFDRLEASVDERFDAVDARFDGLETSVNSRFDSLQADVKAILDRLGPPPGGDDKDKDGKDDDKN